MIKVWVIVTGNRWRRWWNRKNYDRSKKCMKQWDVEERRVRFESRTMIVMKHESKRVMFYSTEIEMEMEMYLNFGGIICKKIGVMKYCWVNVKSFESAWHVVRVSMIGMSKNMSQLWELNPEWKYSSILLVHLIWKILNYQLCNQYSIKQFLCIDV